jgi:hypothetical protein
MLAGLMFSSSTYMAPSSIPFTIIILWQLSIFTFDNRNYFLSSGLGSIFSINKQKFHFVFYKNREQEGRTGGWYQWEGGRCGHRV